MRPVHEFKANFSQKKPVAASQSGGLIDAFTLYNTDSSVRNLCLIWDDGRRVFFSYAYLLAGEFEPHGEKNVIKLSFSSCTVALHGYSLEFLFMELLDHLPRVITATDPRYILDGNKHHPVVIDIILEKEPD